MINHYIVLLSRQMYITPSKYCSYLCFFFFILLRKFSLISCSNLGGCGGGGVTALVRDSTSDLLTVSQRLFSYVRAILNKSAETD